MDKLIKLEGVSKLVTTNELPTHEDGKVTIMVVYVGLCRTDLYVANNTNKSDNIILGHEFSGIVIHDPTNTFTLLDSVTVNPLQNNKFMGVDFNGCLQSYINVEPQYVFKHNLPNIIAAYTEPFSASAAVLKYVNHNHKIGVYGNNRIASLTLSILKALNHNVEIADLRKKDYYDVLVETEINSDNIDSLINTIKEDGKLIIKSRNVDPVQLNLVKCIKKSITIQFANYLDFTQTLQCMKQFSHIITPLLGKVYPIKDWEAAFEEANSNSSKKVFIAM